jgi:hypothetical protein
MIHEAFYKELGKYLYAMAMSDGEVQEQEIKMLVKVISEELEEMKGVVSVESWDVLLAKLSFFTSLREKISLPDARESFNAFIRKYSDSIDGHSKAVAAKLIHRVAASFKGVNKMESRMEDESIGLLTGRH